MTTTQHIAALPPEVFEEISGVIRLLGHPQRLQIVEHLDLHGECAVGEIVTGVGGRQAAVSQHLNQMRAAGIISARRQGRRVLYRLAAESPVTILNCIRRQYRLSPKVANGRAEGTHLRNIRRVTQ